MKHFFKLIALAILATLAFSCEQNDDIEFVSSLVSEPQIISGTNSVVLEKENEDSNAYTLIWKEGDFGPVPTPVTYKVETAASGTNFAVANTIGTTTDTFFNITVEQLNIAAIAAELTPEEEGSLDIRVVASLGNQEGSSVNSDNLTLTVTPFGAVITPKLFIVGSIQGYYGVNNWTPTEAIEMNYIGDGTTKVFEVYVKVGAEDGFKFINDAVDWAELTANYGLETDGDLNGEITNSGGSSNLSPGEAGFYYVRVDEDALTFQLVKMDWGIIGSATPLGWDGETAMTYDFASNSFKINQDLVDGEMKIRSQNTGNAIFESDGDWRFNVGDSGDDSIASDSGDGNFTITADNYDIELAIGIRGKATVSGI